MPNKQIQYVVSRAIAENRFLARAATLLKIIMSYAKNFVY